MKGVETSQAQKQVRPASSQGGILISASPLPQRKKSLPPSTEGSEGDQASEESMALVKRKRAPTQSPVVAGASKGKKVTDAMAVVPIVEKEDHNKKIKDKGKVKVGEEKSGKVGLSPSVLPTDSSVAPAAAQPLAYSTPQRHILPYHGVLQAAQDKAMQEALRLEWTRGAMTA
ncbi:hypothetical protein Dimus_013859 [Dionaea muscipula]